MAVTRPETVFLRTTVPPAPGATPAEALAASVRNTGNAVFETALAAHLAEAAVVTSFEDLPSGVRRLVLSMANFISPATDLGYLADALTRRRVEQIVMVGAGAQAYDTSENVPLTEGTRRFLHLVADRSVTIGVRGAYTAEILARRGIRNVRIIGCPSAFAGAVSPAIGDAPLPPRPRLAVHATPLGHFRDKVSALFRHAMTHGADYIFQSEATLLPLVPGGGPRTAEMLADLLYYAWPECDPEALAEFLGGHGRIFATPEAWSDAIRGYDFVYGARFHGNMVAINAGVPALNMPFDTRTRELCDTLNLPSLPLHRFTAAMSPERLREHADFSFYRATWTAKRDSYTRFLEENGLSHTLPPPADAATPSPAAAAAMALVRDLDAASLLRPEVAGPAVAGRLWPARTDAERTAAETGRFEALPP